MSFVFGVNKNMSYSLILNFTQYMKKMLHVDKHECVLSSIVLNFIITKLYSNVHV